MIPELLTFYNLYVPFYELAVRQKLHLKVLIIANLVES